MLSRVQKLENAVQEYANALSSIRGKTDSAMMERTLFADLVELKKTCADDMAAMATFYSKLHIIMSRIDVLLESEDCEEIALRYLEHLPITADYALSWIGTVSNRRRSFALVKAIVNNTIENELLTRDNCKDYLVRLYLHTPSLAIKSFDHLIGYNNHSMNGVSQVISSIVLISKAAYKSSELNDWLERKREVICNMLANSPMSTWIGTVAINYAKENGLTDIYCALLSRSSGMSGGNILELGKYRDISEDKTLIDWLMSNSSSGGSENAIAYSLAYKNILTNFIPTDKSPVHLKLAMHILEGNGIKVKRENIQDVIDIVLSQLKDTKDIASLENGVLQPYFDKNRRYMRARLGSDLGI